MTRNLNKSLVLVTTVESSTLSHAAYDAASQLLWLKFQSGAEYCYFDVPPDVHQELISAPSKGKYFNQYIRGHFPYRKQFPAVGTETAANKTSIPFPN